MDEDNFEMWYDDCVRRTIRKVPEELPMGILDTIFPGIQGALRRYETQAGFPDIGKNMRSAFGRGAVKVRWFSADDVCAIARWIFENKVAPGRFQYVHASRIAEWLHVTQGEVTAWMDAGAFPHEVGTHSVAKRTAEAAVAEMARRVMQERMEHAGDGR